MQSIGDDFETYSEIDLRAAGLHNYATHKSTGAHCMSYGADPEHVKIWVEGETFPEDLAAHIESGGILTAWNAAFELAIWNLCCVPRYGWPPLPIHQVRCSMVRAYAMALPGALEDAAPALGVDQRKDAAGHRIMLQLSKPKKDGTMWRRDAESLDKFLSLYSYNKQDVRTELACLDRLMELSPSETLLWELDYKINNRGVLCDLASANKGIAIIQFEQKRLNGEMLKVTDGVVGACTEVQMLGKWIKSQGVEMDGLAKADVLNALAEADENAENEDFPPWLQMPLAVRRALELRQEAAKSSTAKLVTMREKASADGRLRNMHQYHAASTGRWGGRGVQPQNFFRGRPGVTYEDIEAMFSMLGDKEMLDLFYGPAMAAISDCLRGMLIAGEGNELVACDFSAVEARVLPWLAGQESVLEVFRTHGLIYEHAAANIYHIPIEEVTKDQRQRGKVSILACVAEDTQVLTNHGYKAIVEVTTDDLVWDGVEWAKHQGLIAKGYREVINLDGLQITPEHLISAQGTWQKARTLNSNASTLRQALETGLESLQCGALNESDSERAMSTWLEFSAPAGPRHTSCTATICEKARLLGATLALKKQPVSGGKTTSGMRTLCLTTPTGEGCSAEYLRASLDAIALPTSSTVITVAGASMFLSLGEQITALFSRMSSLWKAGMFRLWKSIGSMWTKATSPVTYASSQGQSTSPTSARSAQCKHESSILRPVFDLLNVGSRNCFLVKTNSGHLLIHNCGYGGGVGAFQAMARTYNVTISDEEAEEIKSAWRAANRKIVQYWYDLEEAVLGAMRSGGVHYAGAAGRQIKFRKSGSFLWALLPSGRALCYPYPELRMVMTPWGEEKEQLTFMTVIDQTQKKKAKTFPDPNAKGRWQRVSTYGGSLAENMTQAIARDLLAEAMVKIEAERCEIIFHVHDEIVAEVQQFRAQYALERMTAVMSDAPPWAKGLPLAAEGFHAKRYRKG